MKKKISPKAILIPTISLFLICACVTALLALTNNITAEKIAENEAKSKQDSMFTVMPDAASFGDAVDLSAVFEEAGADGSEEMIPALDQSGAVIGYAISASTQGYGGKVKVMTGVDAAGTIVGVDVFYNDDETPGLGKNTSNPSFTDQYKGLSSDAAIAVSKDSANGSDQTVDAVTSATISSRAVTKAVDTSCRIYQIYTQKEAQ